MRTQALKIRAEAARNLDRTVLGSTAELRASNRDLEAFSYSVAHDLRTPLRSISGFSSILEEEHSACLDEEGRRLLGIVRQSC